MKIITFSILLLIGSTVIYAQNNEFLPLSRYGYGTLSSFYAPFSQGCGHAGIAYTGIDEFNASNPATLGFLKVTDAEIGYNIKFKEISDQRQTLNDRSGSLSYLEIGIPLRNSINQILERKEYKNNFGLSVGLLPFSSTSFNYQINDSTDVGAQIRKLTGSGGLNKLQLGFGFKYKNFGIGANLGIIFGNLKFEQFYYLRDVYPSSKDHYIDRYFGSGTQFQLAMLYQTTLNNSIIKSDLTKKAKTLSYSLVVSLPSNISMSRYALHYSELSFANVSSIRDTILYKDDNLSKSQLPFKVTGGISFNNKDKNGILLDGAIENWSNLNLFEGVKGELTNQSFIAVGAWIKPDQSGYGKILKRSQYRIGCFYENGYLKIKDETLTNYGITIGMGTSFNFQRQQCVVNLGLELGKSQIANQITENYLKINLGVRINDSEWFLKRRYE